jgi:glycosyltransferase involved in cell wall biosynthesis
LTDIVSSVVIPAFNEGVRLPPLLADLVAQAPLHNARPVEFIVVDDGSAPDHLVRHRACTEAAAKQLAALGSPHRVRLVECGINQGKAAAVRRGWQDAAQESAWLAFVDADGAISASEIWRLVGLLDDRWDLLAGSRVLMAGRTIDRSLARHLQGRVFATLTEWAFHLGFYDTQCGVKFVRGSLVRPHLEVLQERRWMLDIELLALVRLLGGRMREEPIDWREPGGSKVRPIVDAVKMFFGIMRIRRHLARVAPTLPAPLSSRGQ